jgi:hypothetical protein
MPTTPRATMPDLFEPDAVRVDDFLRRVQLPHRAMRRHTAQRERHAPELHPQPQRANLWGHETNAKVADAVHRVAHVHDAEIQLLE